MNEYGNDACEAPFEWNPHVTERIDSGGVSKRASDISELLGADPDQPAVNTSVLTAQARISTSTQSSPISQGDTEAQEILEWMQRMSDDDDDENDEEDQDDAGEGPQPVTRHTSEASDIVYVLLDCICS